MREHYEIEVQHLPFGPWEHTREIVGTLRFETLEEATKMIEALKVTNQDYYAGCQWRVVRGTREIYVDGEWQ